MAAVESSFKRNFLKQKEIQIRKFLALKDHYQTTATLKVIQESEKYCPQFIRACLHRIGRIRA
jgi:hypothetical protein